MISNDNAPAPCVYSPVDPILYFAISVAITIAFLFSPPLTQSMQFSSASTPPIHAKVRSTISQFLKHLFPNESLSKSSTTSITYEEIGFEESSPVSVPK